MVLKAILLEFRGVLIDDRWIQSSIMKDLFLDQNLSLHPQEYEDLIKEQDDRSCLQILLERRGRVHTLDELNQLLQKRFNFSLESLPPSQQELSSPTLEKCSPVPMEKSRSSLLLPDVKDLLFRARSLALKVVLITSSIQCEVDSILNMEQIAPYFDLILSGEQLSCQPIKPWAYTHAIDCLNQIYPNLNLTPQNCLAIEAIYQHLEAARSLGISVAAVSRYRPIHFLQRRADWAVDRLTDLELDRINANLSPNLS